MVQLLKNVDQLQDQLVSLIMITEKGGTYIGWNTSTPCERYYHKLNGTEVWNVIDNNLGMCNG